MRSLLTLLWVLTSTSVVAAQWTRHTIDQTSRGADGVRIADINGDQLPDLVTGWEEGGRIRTYLNPGSKAVKEPWPAETVGLVNSPEDAVFADLDGDGRYEVISCCEGRTESVFVHWQDPQTTQWSTQPFPQLQGKAKWMFAAPLQVDEKHGVDLVIAAKGKNAEIGWLQAPANARQLSSWTWHPLSKVGWVMSVRTFDMDGDGDKDILYSDRKSSTRGIHWLELGSATDVTARWQRHTVGGTDREVMFLDTGDLNHDGRTDIAVAVKDGPLTWFERFNSNGRRWQRHDVSLPPGTGSGKGVAIVDIDLDGRNDLVYSCEHSENKFGVGWLASSGDRDSIEWRAHDISGTKEGIKFDLIRTLDLDHDGDLDVVTCEERDNLGVIWYENPTRSD